jgi:hypothetical protein
MMGSSARSQAAGVIIAPLSGSTELRGRIERFETADSWDVSNLSIQLGRTTSLWGNFFRLLELNADSDIPGWGGAHTGDTGECI